MHAVIKIFICVPVLYLEGTYYLFVFCWFSIVLVMSTNNFTYYCTYISCDVQMTAEEIRTEHPELPLEELGNTDQLFNIN